MIGVVDDHTFTTYDGRTRDETDTLVNIVQNNAYQFIVLYFCNYGYFSNNERCIGLIKDIPKDKLRVVYGCEGSAFPYSNGIPTVIQFMSEYIMDFILERKDDNCYFSKLGFTQKERYMRFYKPIDNSIKMLSKFKKLFWYGSEKTSFSVGKRVDPCMCCSFAEKCSARELEIRHVKMAGIEVVIGKFDAEKESLLDCLIRHECCGLLGTDGNAIQCHRDHEAIIAGIPYLRITSLPVNFEIVDHYSAAICESLYSSYEQVRTALNRIRSFGKEYLSEKQETAKRICSNLLFFQTMDAIVCNRNDFWGLCSKDAEVCEYVKLGGRVSKVADPLVFGTICKYDEDSKFNPLKKLHLSDFGLSENIAGTWKTTHGRTYIILLNRMVKFVEEYKQCWMTRMPSGEICLNFKDGKLEIITFANMEIKIAHFDPIDSPFPTLTASAVKVSN